MTQKLDTKTVAYAANQADLDPSRVIEVEPRSRQSPVKRKI